MRRYLFPAIVLTLAALPLAYAPPAHATVAAPALQVADKGSSAVPVYWRRYGYWRGPGWRAGYWHRPYWRGYGAVGYWHRPYWRRYGAVGYWHRPYWRGYGAVGYWHRPYWRRYGYWRGSYRRFGGWRGGRRWG